MGSFFDKIGFKGIASSLVRHFPVETAHAIPTMTLSSDPTPYPPPDEPSLPRTRTPAQRQYARELYNRYSEPLLSFFRAMGRFDASISTTMLFRWRDMLEQEARAPVGRP